MSTQRRDRSPVALAMVGLPARGKSYIARKVARYLSWLGHPTRVFNVGSYRREHVGSHKPSEFFDPDNAEGRRVLHDLAMHALDDLIEWLKRGGGEVAIYDATNTTRARREIVERRLREAGIPLVFIESMCNDPSIIDVNVRETKLSSPDYVGVNPDEAVLDFRRRIANYEKAYEPLSDIDGSYIKIIDVGEKVTLRRMQGYLAGRLVPLLINLHITPRPIWVSRHGESAFNVLGIIGGDADLSPRGEEYARSLAAFVRDRVAAFHGAERGELAVWTSSLRRTIQTAQPLTDRPTVLRALDEIDAGVCDGMTYDQIREQMPEVFRARALDKLRYRYPRGESYEDVIQRLHPLIIDLERQRSPILVIAHQAVLRALYAYFMDRPPEVCPKLPVPLHTVIQLTPKAYGCEERRFPLPPSLDAEPSSSAV